MGWVNPSRASRLYMVKHPWKEEVFRNEWTSSFSWFKFEWELQ